MRSGTAALACAVALAGCNNKADVAEDKMEHAAKAQAQAAGSEEAALGLTEMQLLKADLRGIGGVELGDVVKIDRDGTGAVTRLLIEIEDSNPDRFVYIPITGLSTIARGDDTDLETSMTRAELDALPDVKLPTA